MAVKKESGGRSKAGSKYPVAVPTRRSAVPTTKAPNKTAANKAAANKSAGNQKALTIASVIPAVKVVKVGASVAKAVPKKLIVREATKITKGVAKVEKLRKQGKLNDMLKEVEKAKQKNVDALQRELTSKSKDVKKTIKTLEKKYKK